jgi:hypothetical protein
MAQNSLWSLSIQVTKKLPAFTKLESFSQCSPTPAIRHPDAVRTFRTCLRDILISSSYTYGLQMVLYNIILSATNATCVT